MADAKTWVDVAFEAVPGVVTLAGTLGGTWLGAKHQAQQAQNNNEHARELARQEREDARRQALDERREYHRQQCLELFTQLVRRAQEHERLWVETYDAAVDQHLGEPVAQGAAELHGESQESIAGVQASLAAAQLVTLDAPMADALERYAVALRAAELALAVLLEAFERSGEAREEDQDATASGAELKDAIRQMREGARSLFGVRLGRSLTHPLGPRSESAPDGE